MFLDAPAESNPQTVQTSKPPKHVGKPTYTTPRLAYTETKFWEFWEPSTLLLLRGGVRGDLDWNIEMGRVYYSSALELYPYAIHARAWEHEVKLEFGTTVRTVFVSGAEDTSRVRDRSGRDR